MTSNVSYLGGIPPPPGVIPNLQHPHGSRQQLALGIAITCIGLASLFFFTRVYIKLRITRAILAEDGTHDARHTICVRLDLADLGTFSVVCYSLGKHIHQAVLENLAAYEMFYRFCLRRFARA
jgi:hypothetical protein